DWAPVPQHRGLDRERGGDPALSAASADDRDRLTRRSVGWDGAPGARLEHRERLGVHRLGVERAEKHAPGVPRGAGEALGEELAVVERVEQAHGYGSARSASGGTPTSSTPATSLAKKMGGHTP